MNQILAPHDAVARQHEPFGVRDDGGDPLGVLRQGVDMGVHDLKGQLVLIELGHVTRLAQVFAKRRRKVSEAVGGDDQISIVEVRNARRRRRHAVTGIFTFRHHRENAGDIAVQQFDVEVLLHLFAHLRHVEHIDEIDTGEPVRQRAERDFDQQAGPEHHADVVLRRRASSGGDERVAAVDVFLPGVGVALVLKLKINETPQLAVFAHPFRRKRRPIAEQFRQHISPLA